MTIALGICGPDYVLAVADSKSVDWSTSWPNVMLGGSKHERLCDRLYYLVSGYFSSGEPLLRDVQEGKFDHMAVDQLAPRMWAEVRSRMVPAMGTYDGLEWLAALLVAGGPKGHEPGLVLYRTNREPEVAPGDVVVSGAITEWAEAALRLGISTGEMEAMVKRGTVRSLIAGWTVVVPTSEVDKFRSKSV